MKYYLRTIAILVLTGCSLPALLAAQATAVTPVAMPFDIHALHSTSITGSNAAPLVIAPPPDLALTPVPELAFLSAPGAATPPPGLIFAAASAPRVSEPSWPLYELFAGYSNFRSLPMFSPDNRLAWASGISTSLAVNFNRMLGIVFDGAYYRATRFGPYAPPSGGVVSASGNIFTLMVGPRLSFRYSRLTPFVQGLFGMDYDGRVALSNCSGFGCAPLPEETSYTMALGGGLDLTLTSQLALRLFQIEYEPTRFRDPTSSAGTLEWQNDTRLSTGLVFRFGGSAPAAGPAPAPPPPNMTCLADPSMVMADSGAMVRVRASANDSNGYALTYSWTASGGTVEGSGARVRWSSSGVAPGDYTVNGHVVNQRGGAADCSATVHVSAPPRRPPTMTCSIAPEVIASGDHALITATANSPGGNSLTYSWQAASGQITGTGPSVTFDSTGLAPGPYSATGQIDDGQGGTANCLVSIEVQAAPEPTPVALVERLSLHSIYFPTAQPTVQVPEGGLVPSQQAILTTLATDFKLYLEANPDATLTLEGHADERASQAYNDALAERRVDTSRGFLVGLGVPEANIETHAYGKHEELDEAQVRQQMQDNPHLTPDQRDTLLANLHSVILAQNRRVDIVLSGTGQTSKRQYPFNAKDALTLLSDNALRP